jgi:hypothetical protein
MPPDPVEHSEIVSRGLDHYDKEGADFLYSFYDADVFKAAAVSSQFTAFEMHQRLIALTRSADEKTALAAQRELAARNRERLEISGLLTTTKRTAIVSPTPGVLAIQQQRTLSLTTSIQKEMNNAEELLGATIHEPPSPLHASQQDPTSSLP